ncbi:hypothetical protein [Subtercola frigoramans]|uniref:Uncharacterized protein n=1 Tax=Subtercola frigoramans TaxID=120298 RepID=A0ABS2L6W4_9MICO|nr:hypothetical protein [Subtercola frigoramans]MBM7472749.1 hypothetical protein [Subtercola frigoramans]
MADELDERSVARRTVLRGVAWTVPTVAFAVAAPASSASGPVIIFDSVVVMVDHAEDPIILDGFVSGVASTRPAFVALSYSAGFTGDATAAVNADSGSFRATAYAASGPSTGSAIASAPGYADASVGLQVNAH